MFQRLLLLKAAFPLLLLGGLFALGCAGGSTPLGIRVRGTITPPLSALVTITETGETDLADPTFDISSSTFAEDLTLRFQGDGFDQAIVLNGIPDTTEELSLTLEFQSGILVLTSVRSFPGDLPLTTTTTTTTTLPSPQAPSLFGIPSGITGNSSRGERLWNRTCVTCHLREKRGATYTDIRRALRSEPQMRSLTLSTQETADLTMYLNGSTR